MQFIAVIDNKNVFLFYGYISLKQKFCCFCPAHPDWSFPSSIRMKKRYRALTMHLWMDPKICLYFKIIYNVIYTDVYLILETSPQITLALFKKRDLILEWHILLVGASKQNSSFMYLWICSESGKEIRNYRAAFVLYISHGDTFFCVSYTDFTNWPTGWGFRNFILWPKCIWTSLWKWHHRGILYYYYCISI